MIFFCGLLAAVVVLSGIALTGRGVVADRPVSVSSCRVRVETPAREIPAGPEAYTTRDFREEVLAFNRRTIGGAYRELGSRDPRWDAAALEFLENLSREFAHLPGRPSMEELRAEGEKLIQAGCDDPMVFYGYGTALQCTNDWEEAEKYVRLSLDGLIERGYPVNRTLFAVRRLIEIHGHLDRKGELRELRELHYQKFLETLQSDIYREGEERILLEHVASGLNLIRGYSPSRLDEFTETIKDLPGIDPWVRDTLAGKAHIKLAWATRGSGWAHTVDQEGWRGFEEHLSEANLRLTAAWERQTGYPEAAAYMITVAMGGGANPGEGARFWFDRAVAAQFDYEPAYNGLFWALRPRWGGSHDRMYALGLECLNTRRFDTKVPQELIWALIKIEQDVMDDSYWRRPGVYENVEAVFQGIEEEPSRSEKDKRYHRSLHAAVAWCVDDFDRAGRLLDELGDEVDDRALEAMGTSLAGMRWDIGRGAAGDR